MNPPLSRSCRFLSFVAVLVFASSGALGAADDPDPGPDFRDPDQTRVADSGLSPDISSEGVVYSKEVWTGEDYLPAIFYWDGTDTTQISDPGQVRKPRIDGGSIVWEDDSGRIYWTTVPEPTGGLLAACRFGVLAARASSWRWPPSLGSENNGMIH